MDFLMCMRGLDGTTLFNQCEQNSLYAKQKGTVIVFFSFFSQESFHAQERSNPMWQNKGRKCLRTQMPVENRVIFSPDRDRALTLQLGISSALTPRSHTRRQLLPGPATSEVWGLKAQSCGDRMSWVQAHTPPSPLMPPSRDQQGYRLHWLHEHPGCL